MARIEEGVDIGRPLDEVFAYTLEAHNWPLWQTFILQAEQTSDGPVRVGATFKGVARMLGRSMDWTATATEYELNESWGKTIRSGSLVIKERLMCSSAVDGTHFTVAYEMDAGGLMKLLSPIMARSMRGETLKSLGNLKDLLEAQGH